MMKQNKKKCAASKKINQVISFFNTSVIWLILSCFPEYEFIDAGFFEQFYNPKQ